MTKLLTIIFTLSTALLYAKPLEIYLPIMSILPSEQSLSTVNVETVQADSYQNKKIIGDVLNKSASFQTVRSGPLGQNTSVFTRGANSNHTLFLINGSPITDHSTTNGLFDAGVDPVTYSSSVDLYKGGQGTLFGPNAVAGAVNINTGVSFHNEAEVTYGSNNTTGGSVTLSNSLGSGNHNFTINTFKEKSDGISIYQNGAEPDGYDYSTINLNTLHYLGNTVINTTIVQRNADADLDGANADDTDYTSDAKFYFYQTRIDNPNFNLVLDTNTHDREYVNGTEIDSYDSSTEHMRLSHTNNLGPIDFTVGTDLSTYSAKFDNKGSYNSSVDKSAENIAGFVNFDINHNSWLMNAGVRRDDNSLHSSVNTYRFGVGYRANDIITLTAGTNTGFKAPSLYEMYGADNYGYTGNANLTEEKSVTYETGIKTKVEEFESQFNIFTTRVSDQIKYDNSAYSNDTDGAHVTKGWEFSSTQSDDNTRLSISVTGLSVQDSAKNEVTRRPKLSSYVGIEQNINEKLTLWGTYNFYGNHKDIHPTTYATVDMEYQTTLDAGFGYTVNEDVVVNGTLTNIGDLEYERPYGYNQDGPAFNISIKYLF